MRKSVTELLSARDLLLNLTAREIKGKYKRTALGQLWSLINPLAQMAIFSVVFGFVMRAKPDPGDPSGLDNFALWLTAALLPWILFAGVLNGAMQSILANENLVKKVWFARSTLVVSAALAVLFTSAFEMATLVVVLYLFGGNPTWYLPLVAVFMILLAAFALGIGFMLAISNVYFRDTQHVISLLIQIWFYLTPIVYPISLIEGRAVGGHHWILTVYRLNPVERYCEVFRNLLYDNRLPSIGSTAYCVGVSLIVLVLGYMIFSRYEGRLAEEL